MKDEGMEVKKTSYGIVIASAALWFSSLLSGTGIGNVYNIYGKTVFVLLLCLFYQMFFNGHFKKIDKTLAIFIIIIIFQNLYTNLVFKQNFLEYAEIYAIPILYSLYTVNEKQMRSIGLIYGIGGGMVLLVANYTNFFAGWDGNSVSQICFFSYAVFIASLFDIKTRKNQQRIVIYSLVYFVLLWTLHSRSCILFSMFLLLCELGLIPVRNTINRETILIWLLVPLFVAIIITTFNNAEFIESLNKWSVQHFSKPIFNGRDNLWSRGFILLGENPLLGNGTFYMNWHNSAIACLTGAGTLGYFIWIYIIRNMLVKACKFIDDNVIFGAVTAFISVWIQQSVEQGMIGPKGNPVIMVLLGLILARTHLLLKNEEEEKLNSEQKNV